MKPQCGCFDPMCEHSTKGHDGPVRTMFRIDMDDRSGTEFCETCAFDALASGLFSEMKLADYE